MKLNDKRIRSKLERQNSWQGAKHVRLYSVQLRASRNETFGSSRFSEERMSISAASTPCRRGFVEETNKSVVSG